MDTRSKRRHDAIERLADFLLSEGLGAATLRSMAAAAGTSDRMLLYYFADTKEILSATVHRIAERMLNVLDEAVPPGRPRPFGTLLEEVGAVLASADVQPFMHFWLDLSSGAARGLEPHHHAAGEIADGFLAWVTGRLEADEDGEVAGSAALFMTLVKGMHVLEAIGRPLIAETAAHQFIRAAINRKPRARR